MAPRAWHLFVESSFCQEWEHLEGESGIKEYAVFLRKEMKKGETKKEKILSFHLLSACFFSLLLSYPTAASCYAGDSGWTQWLSF